jgi:phosphomannomutase
MNIFRNTLETKPPKSIAGMGVQKSITVDGHKFILDGSTWIGFRLSGTEPLVRIYAESDSQAKLNKLLKTNGYFVYGK